MKQLQKGFTLIELMIVVAIVGILAAIALPAYQDYTVRARVSEAAAAAGACKTAVAEFYASNADLPDTTSEAGCSGTDAATQYVASTTVGTDGVITVSLSDDTRLGGATGGQLVLTPTTGGGSGGVIATWACTGTPVKFMPGTCRG